MIESLENRNLLAGSGESCVTQFGCFLEGVQFGVGMGIITSGVSYYFGLNNDDAWAIGIASGFVATIATNELCKWFFISEENNRSAEPT